MTSTNTGEGQADPRAATDGGEASFTAAHPPSWDALATLPSSLIGAGMDRPARPASSWSIPSPGETIEGRMRVLDRLGRGSHGEVHRGWDLAHHRFVALKIARDPDPCVARDALLREMLPLRAVAHPHLVRLERAHFGRRSGFVALELLDPTPLSARVAAGALPARAAVRVVAGLADALEAMHAAGWAHRDVKAENVLFGPRDRPVLADLGLACSRGLLDDDLRMAPGTPSYMAPEVVRGAVDCFDGWRAVDQYALGVTAYYALTGAMPFQERGIYAQMFAHLALEPTPPSARRPALAPLDGVILRALAKDPGARFDGVGAFGAALRRAARGA